MTEWQRVQIFDEMVHYDVHFEIFNPLSYQSYQLANEALIRRLKTDKSIDLFMNCASSDMLFEETMRELKTIAVPKLLICFDNLHAPFMHKSIAQYFDKVWLTSKETEPLFKQWGCNTIFQPYAANPYLYVDRYNRPVDRVAFVGTPYGTRSTIINDLLSGNVPCDVYFKRQRGDDGVAHSAKPFLERLQSLTRMLRFPIGRKVLYSKIVAKVYGTQLNSDNPFFYAKSSLSFEEMNSTYSNYGLSLNIIDLLTTAVLKKPIHKLHLRTFEIPMSAGLELVASNEELKSYFTDDEMVFYSNSDEMVDKARFYLQSSNESLCRQMKIKARKHAEREHCWKCRFDVVFKSMNLKS